MLLQVNVGRPLGKKKHGQSGNDNVCGKILGIHCLVFHCVRSARRVRWGVYRKSRQQNASANRMPDVQDVINSIIELFCDQSMVAKLPEKLSNGLAKVYYRTQNNLA